MTRLGITRHQGQLKVTFDADILYPECGWPRNSQARATLSKSVPTLQGLRHTQSVVNGYAVNVPARPEPQRMGIESDLASQRANGVVQYLKSQGVAPNLLSAQEHRAIRASRNHNEKE